MLPRRNDAPAHLTLMLKVDAPIGDFCAGVKAMPRTWGVFAVWREGVKLLLEFET